MVLQNTISLSNDILRIHNYYLKVRDHYTYCTFYLRSTLLFSRFTHYKHVRKETKQRQQLYVVRFQQAVARFLFRKPTHRLRSDEPYSPGASGTAEQRHRQAHPPHSDRRNTELRQRNQARRRVAQRQRGPQARRSQPEFLGNNQAGNRGGVERQHR